MSNRDKIIAPRKVSDNNRWKTDNNFCSICKTRSKFRQVLSGKSKISSTKDILRMDINTFRNWIQFQFKPQMSWDNIEINHVKPTCMFKVFDLKNSNLHSIGRILNHYSKKFILKKMLIITCYIINYNLLNLINFFS